jgi:hypothetical protein
MYPIVFRTFRSQPSNGRCTRRAAWYSRVSMSSTRCAWVMNTFRIVPSLPTRPFIPQLVAFQGDSAFKRHKKHSIWPLKHHLALYFGIYMQPLARIPQAQDRHSLQTGEMRTTEATKSGNATHTEYQFPAACPFSLSPQSMPLRLPLHPIPVAYKSPLRRWFRSPVYRSVNPFPPGWLTPDP